jgi:hypothetical protein
MTASQIEISVAEYFGMKGMQNRNLIIPNFKGFWIHECDLLIVTPQRYCYEVEIKVSIADLKADLGKRHAHKDERLHGLYFAIPDSMYTPQVFKMIPHVAGILVIADNKCHLNSKPHLNKDCRKLTDKEYLHLGRILCHRLWNAKRKLLEGK